MVLDFWYIITVGGDEHEYWYRLGFAVGDFYVRIFYRAYYGPPVI